MQSPNQNHIPQKRIGKVIATLILTVSIIHPAAESKQPEAQIEHVIRGYFIDVSAPDVRKTTQTESVSEWIQNYKTDPAKAEIELNKIWHAVRDQAIKHYEKKGDQERAHKVATLTPDMNNIRDRALGAKFSKPDTLMEDVVRGYIIDASASPPSVQKLHPIEKK